jgi:hypothetical protein
MPKPNKTDLAKIEISSIPDTDLLEIIWRCRKNTHSDPAQIERAWLAHANLELRQEVRDLQKQVKQLFEYLKLEPIKQAINQSVKKETS